MQEQRLLMPDSIEDLQVEVDGLRDEITIARRNSRDFAERHFNTTRESALGFCLASAADIGQGCDLMAEAKLLAPLYTLTRCLLESLFWVNWIVMSDENAKVFVDASINEMKRLARENLRIGFATVTDRVTGEDKTGELLESDWRNGISSRPGIYERAKASGLERAYKQMYGFLSIQAHGPAFGFEVGSAEEELLAVMALANVLLRCINLVVEAWIVKRKQTSPEEIYAILMPPRQSAT